MIGVVEVVVVSIVVVVETTSRIVVEISFLKLLSPDGVDVCVVAFLCEGSSEVVERLWS